MSELEKIDLLKVPRHVAIIMDGNGRWARGQGRQRIFGHSNGVEAVRATLKAATRIGVKYLTYYAFSTENWARPKDEVEALMDLLVQTIMAEVDELHKNGVKLDAIGDLDGLPPNCREQLEQGMKHTAGNSVITLVLALNYSARWEITDAVKRIAALRLKPEQIDENVVSAHLCSKQLPNPELLIRTGGERRISNFLLWQIAYTELYFTDTFWPDFMTEDFYKAIVDYQGRERRFGKTSEQIAQNPAH